MRPHPAGLPALILSCLGSACSSEASTPAPAVLVRDSGGIRVVAHADAAAANVGLVDLGDVNLVIGSADTAAPYEFHNVRRVVRLSNGMLAVLDAGAREITFFDSAGVHQSTVGRSGRGPGEFRLPMLLQLLAADTLVVFDAINRRFTFLTPQGTLRTFAGPASLSGVVGMLPPGKVLTAEPGRTSWQEGLRKMPLVVRLMDLESERADTLEVVGQRANYQFIEGDQLHYEATPFTVYGKVATDGNVLHVTDCVEDAIRTYDATGSLLRIVRLGLPRVKVTADEVRSYIETRLEQADRPEMRTSLRRAYAAMSPPAEKPWCDGLFAARNGKLWVRHYVSVTDTTQRWLILGADGRAEAAVVLPAEFRLLDAADDHVLGIVQNALGVHRIGEYRRR